MHTQICQIIKLFTSKSTIYSARPTVHSQPRLPAKYNDPSSILKECHKCCLKAAYNKELQMDIQKLSLIRYTLHLSSNTLFTYHPIHSSPIIQYTLHLSSNTLFTYHPIHSSPIIQYTLFTYHPIHSSRIIQYTLHLSSNTSIKRVPN